MFYNSLSTYIENNPILLKKYSKFIKIQENNNDRILDGFILIPSYYGNFICTTNYGDYVVKQFSLNCGMNYNEVIKIFDNSCLYINIYYSDNGFYFKKPVEKLYPFYIKGVNNSRYELYCPSYGKLSYTITKDDLDKHFERDTDNISVYFIYIRVIFGFNIIIIQKVNVFMKMLIIYVIYVTLISLLQL